MLDESEIIKALSNKLYRSIEYIENEKSILLAQALKEGKPAEIAEKMVMIALQLISSLEKALMI